MRLIDADLLKFSRVRIVHEDGTIGGYNAVVMSSEIKHAPTVDAVPVIRCKDCKWYYRGGTTCMFWDGANSMCGDDYCSRGRRKDES